MLPRAAFLVVSSVLASSVVPAQVTTELVDRDSGGVQPSNALGAAPAVSADGRFVTFHAYASLVPGTPPNSVYRRDLRLGTTELVSAPASGMTGQGLSFVSSISADGRVVAFDSFDAALVPGDTNGRRDVFARDMVLGTTVRVSVSSSGSEAHGDYQWTGVAPQPRTLSISADGRFVAFETTATDLVAADTNSAGDVFVHDLVTRITERVSVASSGAQGDSTSGFPSISADGRYVAFQSRSTNLVPGRTVPGYDVFVHDRTLGTTELVSVGSTGHPARRESRWPSISADGRWVAFESGAHNLEPGAPVSTWGEIYVRDRVLGTTTLVSRPLPGLTNDGAGRYPAISADGNWIAFTDFSSALVAGDTNDQRDVFRWSRATQSIVRMNLGPAGAQTYTLSEWPAISGDGDLVAYQSWANNLVAGDVCSGVDVFASH